MPKFQICVVDSLQVEVGSKKNSTKRTYCHPWSGGWNILLYEVVFSMWCANYIWIVVSFFGRRINSVAGWGLSVVMELLVMLWISLRFFHGSFSMYQMLGWRNRPEGWSCSVHWRAELLPPGSLQKRIKEGSLVNFTRKTRKDTGKAFSLLSLWHLLTQMLTVTKGCNHVLLESYR